MKTHGLGNLYHQLKDMESRLLELERMIVEYTVLNDNPIKEVADKLIEDYKNLKSEYDRWMTKTVYEE